MVTIKEIRNKISKRNNAVNEDDIDEHRRNVKYDDDDDDDDDSSEDDDNDDNDSSEEDEDEEQESLHDDNQLYSDDNSEFENDSDGDTDDDDDDTDDDDTKKRKHNDKNNDIINDDHELRNLPLGERLRRQMEQGDISNTKWKQIRKEKHENIEMKNTKLNKNTSSSGIKKDNTLSTSTKEKDMYKKKSKHIPKEMSSKRKDFYHQQKIDLLSGGCSSIGTSINVHTNLYKPHDPRSNTNNIHTTTRTSNKSRGGKKLLLETLHDTNDYQYKDYEFIQEMRNEEIRTLQKRIKAYQMTGRKGQEHRKRYNCINNENGLIEDQKLLHQLLQEKANYERKQLDIKTKRIVQETIYKKRKHDNSNNNDHDTTGIGDQNDHQHSSNNNNNNSNKKKYVPKAREVKRMYIETKYDLLQQQKGGQNKIDKIIYKKHLKNKSKDSKFM